MNSLLKKISITLLVLILLTCFQEVFAYRNPFEGSYDSLEEMAEAIINFLFWTTIVLCPLIIVIGAFFIITAAGDPGKVKKGRTIIAYAAIGLAIVLLSRGLVALVRSLIEADTG